MSSEIAVRVDDLSKCYQIYDSPSARLKQSLMGRARARLGLAPKRYFREFWAVRNVSFEVPRGQTVGIVGRNGSGKSTLLQMICGTLNPTTGDVTTRGRIAALLELGSAFNPEFTGRENVYMNGTVLGFRRDEISRRFDEIVDFAGVDAFIDQPVKTYSSGMRLRLAFAVQAQLDPDILVVDEALAVGDARFQAKCFARLRRLKENGTSILLVTHATEQVVTHCDAALLLDAGRPLMTGQPREVINRYLDLLFGREAQGDAAGTAPVNVAAANAPASAGAESARAAELDTTRERFASRPNYNPHEYRWGDGAAEILDFELRADETAFPTTIAVGARMRLRLAIRFGREVVRPILGVTIKTKEGVTVFGTNTERLADARMRDVGRAGSVITATVGFDCRLAPGDYFVSLGLASRQGDGVTPHDRRYDAIHLHVGSEERLFGLVDLGMTIDTSAADGSV